MFLCKDSKSLKVTVTVEIPVLNEHTWIRKYLLEKSAREYHEPVLYSC